MLYLYLLFIFIIEIFCQGAEQKKVGYIRTGVEEHDDKVMQGFSYSQLLVEEELKETVGVSTSTSPTINQQLIDLKELGVEHIFAYCTTIIPSDSAVSYIKENNLLIWCLDSRPEQCEKNFFYLVDGANIFFSCNRVLLFSVNTLLAIGFQQIYHFI